MAAKGGTGSSAGARASAKASASASATGTPSGVQQGRRAVAIHAQPRTQSRPRIIAPARAGGNVNFTKASVKKLAKTAAVERASYEQIIPLCRQTMNLRLYEILYRAVCNMRTCRRRTMFVEDVEQALLQMGEHHYGEA